MNVHKIELMISAVKETQYPEPNMPEIALAGRSNVGKSSFINKLTQRSNIARTSSQPGKTQTLNFYNINDQFRIVDVPGYGYAKVSKKDREKFNQMVSHYFTTRENLKGLFLMMDFRHQPTDLDIAMKNFADELNIPYAIVATKIDKVKRSQYNKYIQQFVRTLNLPSEDALFLFSSETGEGSEDIWEIIETLIHS